MSKISAREMLRESLKQGLIKTARMPYEKVGERDTQLTYEGRDARQNLEGLR